MYPFNNVLWLQFSSAEVILTFLQPAEIFKTFHDRDMEVVWKHVDLIKERRRLLYKEFIKQLIENSKKIGQRRGQTEILEYRKHGETTTRKIWKSSQELKSTILNHGNNQDLCDIWFEEKRKIWHRNYILHGLACNAAAHAIASSASNISDELFTEKKLSS